MKRSGSKPWCIRTRSAPSRPMASRSAGAAGRVGRAGISDRRTARLVQRKDRRAVPLVARSPDRQASPNEYRRSENDAKPAQDGLAALDSRYADGREDAQDGEEDG